MAAERVADRAAEARELLLRTGADALPHPGGTLLAHLERVRALLAYWGARPALQLAGLCHAAYGTDGFPGALLPLDRRPDLVSVIGTEAEAIVYFYASCDRKGTYPTLTDGASPFHDRFPGGGPRHPAPQLLRDFAELTAANELDLARRDPAFRRTYGPDLLDLFTRCEALLSDPARRDCHAVLRP
ncbi:DUF6817 domain-containing protein [Streptomyces olivochromogenes]|uniref:DUF6817 domain-containing protein n=1 Tax=Streptomyces olivochromogenes TaxID=1963 RepID=UPI001F1BB5BA|nr:hypothetical protein [Streptomyces olivochromogenes]